MTHFQCPCWLQCPGPDRTFPPSIIPLMQCGCPLAEKHPQSIMFPPPCLMVGMVFLGSFLFLQTRRVELIQKSWIVVSSDHNTFTQFSSDSLANFRPFHMLSLAGGTLRALQGFSPSRCSVSLTISSRVVLG